MPLSSSVIPREGVERDYLSRQIAERRIVIPREGVESLKAAAWPHLMKLSRDPERGS